MRLNHLHYFLVLSKELNFTRAARHCNISQPSLSNAIKALEQAMGGRLFHRGKTVTMTAFGEKVQPYLQRAFVSIEKAKSMADDQLGVLPRVVHLDDGAFHQDMLCE
jgi:DNA-binding transcriptional LysR family regulator